MTLPGREQQKIREFKRRKIRQAWAVGIALFLVLSVLWKLNHPGLFTGTLSRSTAFLLEIVIIAAFIAFSALNWRCPSCSRYLGPDIARKVCRHCKTRLQ